MKVRSGALAIAAALSTVLLVSSPAVAAPVTDTGDGVFVTVDFVKKESIQCADGSTSIKKTQPHFKAERILFSSNGSPVVVEFQSLFTRITIYDGCTGSFTQLEGELLFGRGLFEFGADGRSASAQARIDLFNRTTGLSDGEAIVDLNWLATSRPDVAVDKRRVVDGNVTTVFKTTTKTRQASVSGSYAIDDQELLLGGRHLTATIGTEKLVTTTRTRG